MFRIVGLILGVVGLTAEQTFARQSWVNFNDISGWLDLRGAYSTSGREFLDGGFSKTRYGSVSGEGVDGEIAEATLLWTPTFSHVVSGHLHLQAGPDQEMPASAVEAFAVFRTPPVGRTKTSIRAGRFFPPVSLEHDGPAWSMTRTITPSAINSWIGEEVAVIGAESKTGIRFANHDLELRVAAFGFNDTAGALLAYRGWALHDLKTVIGGSLQIPADYARRRRAPAQAERTRPTREIDGRVGVYGAMKWSYADLFRLSMLFYDNRADPMALVDGQYGWASRFLNGGVALWPHADFQILAQAMIGNTHMGPPQDPNARTRAFDNDFFSAYVLTSQKYQNHTFSARFDLFSVDNRAGYVGVADEDGWSMTAAWLFNVNQSLRTGMEVLYTDNQFKMSDRTNMNGGAVQLQASVRFQF